MGGIKQRKVEVNNQKSMNPDSTVDFRNYQNLNEYITAGLHSLDDEDSKFPTLKKSARQKSINTSPIKDFRNNKTSR